MSLFSGETTSKPKIPNWAEGLYKDIFKDAQQAYKKGPYFYDKSTVPGFSDPTKDAFTGMKDLATANTGANGMGGWLQAMMSNGGYSADQLSTMGGMKDLMNNQGLQQLIDGNGLTPEQQAAYSKLQGTVDSNNASFADTFGRGGLTTDQASVASRYRDDMNSPFDLSANPAYAQVRGQALNESAQALAANAAKSGRFGGGASQSILAREQGNLANRMDNAEYRNWQQRRDAAAGNLAGLSQTGLTNQQNLNSAQQAGLQNVTNMGALGVDQRSNAIGQKAGLQSQLFNAQNAGLANMGQAYDTAMKPLETQRAVGAEYEQLNRERIADKLRRFDAQNPLNHFQQYLSLANGAPTGSVQTTTPSWLQTGLGIGLGGMGLLGGLFGGKPAAGGVAA